MHNDFDLIAVGAGPAGLSVGIYGGRFGISTLVIGETLGGLAAEAVLVENYPGVESCRGMALVEKIRDQCDSAGAEILLGERVDSISVDSRPFRVNTAEAEYRAGALVLATGCRHRELGVPGEKEFYGRGVSYCAVCDGMFFKGRRVVVIGGGNSAAMEALYLKEIAGKVFMVHRRKSLRADRIMKRRVENSRVELLWQRRVKKIVGEDRVEGVVLEDVETGEVEDLDVDGVFISVGETPSTGYAVKGGIETDDTGFVKVDRDQQTNVPGVYAAGDVTGGVRQIGVAVGEGITAATNAYLQVSGGYYGERKATYVGETYEF